ncbi:uncharacterized protein N7483_000837 [Penicillium malachiteum]|uniref:uncharacterized protein n=1 Tax=Penicillium malachiteum TaxID=1324776 RepID=UPI002546C5CB|nr:uncharacterized protein N7483_000837 [Penicillium malachiteum]KAJ5735712.1 hypothetical protein N7483_000837 [Penicillium malachiteum]
MTRCAEDLAALIGSLLQRDFSSSLTKTWKGRKVGFVDPKIWYIQVREGIWEVADSSDALNLITDDGGKVIQDNSLISYDELKFECLDGLDQVWNHDFAHLFQGLLRSCRDPKVFSRTRSRKENHTTREKYYEAKNVLRKNARVEEYEKAFREYEVDIIAGPLDSQLGSITAVAGHPSATVHGSH